MLPSVISGLFRLFRKQARNNCADDPPTPKDWCFTHFLHLLVAIIVTIVVEYRKILFKTLFKFEVIANIHLNEANRFICKIYHNRKDYLFKETKKYRLFVHHFSHSSSCLFYTDICLKKSKISKVSRSFTFSNIALTAQFS